MSALSALKRAILISPIALPAVAHAEVVERPLPPPSAPMTAAYLMPFSAEQRANWLGECRQRLSLGDHPDFSAIDQGCQAWLHYYESGGAPDPVYGYAIPMETSGGMDCLPCPPAPRPTEKRIRIRRVIHDKRIKL
ncbi:MAG: hypothetical protein KGJ57_15670 [Sphingomonadales bacterium]|nr:hypothetical protein [Sphingomonadales bacterium]MDE2170842.1 hypothetical protein [Sphingomonadales bacterium]